MDCPSRMAYWLSAQLTRPEGDVSSVGHGEAKRNLAFSLTNKVKEFVQVGLKAIDYTTADGETIMAMRSKYINSAYHLLHQSVLPFDEASAPPLLDSAGLPSPVSG